VIFSGVFRTKELAARVLGEGSHASSYGRQLGGSVTILYWGDWGVNSREPVGAWAVAEVADLGFGIRQF